MAANRDDQMRKTILWALAISMMAHLLAFGGWKWGQKHGWWKHNALPRWMQTAQKTLLPKTAKKPLQQPVQSKPVPLLFVDVDPSLSVPTPPKEKKYYSSANTEAASPVKKLDSNLPQITGTQDKVLKTTDTSKSKAQPLQPSPPKPEPKEEPKNEPITEAKPPQPEPKQAQTPGDLAFAKPQEKPEKGMAKSEKVEPKRSRPRTLTEARERSGMQGEKMQQNGGSERTKLTSSLDVAQTSYGDYDRDFIDAVQQRWNQLLQNHGGNSPGKVILEFRLYYDGRIAEMKMIHNDVGEQLGLYCQMAVLDPSPYKRWPTEMRREINADYREIRFTFYYLNR